LNQAKEWTVKIIMACSFIVITLICAEFVVRAMKIGCFFPPPIPPVINRGIWQTEPNMGYDFIENIPRRMFVYEEVKFPIWTNEFGCFDDPYKDEKEFILVAGDSFAMGWVPFEHTWTLRVENEIGKRVLKCAVPGSAINEKYFKAEKVIQKVGKNPKLIIVDYFMGNMDMDYNFPMVTVIDGYLVDQTFISDRNTGERTTRGKDELRERLNNFLTYGSSIAPATLTERVKLWLSRHSALYHLIWINVPIHHILYSIGLADSKFPDVQHYISHSMYFENPGKYPWINKAWEMHFDSLRRIKQLAARYGSELLFFIVPPKEQIYKFLNPAFDNEGYDRSRKKLTAFFENEGINYLDLEPDFIKYSNQKPRKELNTEKDIYCRCDAHNSVKGNYLTGLLLSEFILKKGLIDVEDRNERLLKIEAKLREFK